MSITMRLSDGTIARLERNRIECSMLSRPDERWRYVDPSGHEHRWYANGEPMETYRPENHHDLPTTKVVSVGSFFDPDLREMVEETERRCVLCEARVHAGTQADTTPQYMAGVIRPYIDDRSVSREEFLAHLIKNGIEEEEVSRWLR